LSILLVPYSWKSVRKNNKSRGRFENRNLHWQPRHLYPLVGC